MVHGTGLLLLSAVAGYWVLERAETHKGDLRRVGKVLGWVIIVASIIGVACKVAYLSTGKGFCPFAPKMGTPSAQVR